jgi:thioredoxin 1
MMLRILAGGGLGTALGALMGYLGKCSTGACPLTATPWRGAMFGMLIGLAFALSFGQSRGAAAGAAAGKIKALTGEESFAAEVEKAEGLVLVKFHAPWCGWCRKLAPIVEKLAGEYQSRLSFVGVNTDENRKLAARLGVEGLPTMMLFRDGERIETIVGFRSEEDLRALLEKHLPAEGEARPAEGVAGDEESKKPAGESEESGPAPAEAAPSAIEGSEPRTSEDEN